MGGGTFDENIAPYILILPTINPRGSSYINNSRGKRFTMSPNKPMHKTRLLYSTCYIEKSQEITDPF